MRRGFCKILISVVGIAVLTGVAGCGGTDAPGASSSLNVAAPSPSGPPVDPNVAFKQYEEAARPVECSSAFTEMGDAHHEGAFVVMRDKAREYRDEVATWDAELGKIAFPAAAQQIVDRMRELNADELTGLNELADGSFKDTDRVDVVRNQVEAADSSVVVEGDRLRAVLGHPVPQAGYAADQLQSAHSTFNKTKQQVSPKFKAAQATNDLNGAKAANAIEEDALQRYIDNLDTIDWPSGYEDQVNTLREMLRGFIEFDRRQVDVATVAEIVPAPEEGVPTLQDFRDAKEALWNDLVRVFQKLDPGSGC